MTQKLTTDQARAVLQKENARKIAECKKEVQKALDKYNCTIDCSMVVTARGNIPQVQIVAKVDTQETK